MISNRNEFKLAAKPLQIGLTGSIGMGKTTLSAQFKKLGFSIFDADKEVHNLYLENGGAVEPIRSIYPDVILENSVNRNLLMAKILLDPDVLKQVENIVHPLVAAKRKEFYEKSCREGKFLVVYDIPLLFENLKQYALDYIIVVTACAETQKKRVLSRPGMTEEKFASILHKQVPDAEKRKLANFLVHTDFSGFSETKAQLAHIIQSIINSNPDLWFYWKSGKYYPSNSNEYPFNSNEDVTVKKIEQSVYSSIYGIHPIRTAIDMIVFDLDDTLSPVAAQINNALQAMDEFMNGTMPKTRTALMNKHNLKSIMKRYI